MAVAALQAYVSSGSGAAVKSQDEAEREVRAELAKIWREREQNELRLEPSLAEVPRFFVPKGAPSGSAAPSALDAVPTQHMLHAELSNLARARLREHMASLVLEPTALERLWQLLRQHASPPHAPGAPHSLATAAAVVHSQRTARGSWPARVRSSPAAHPSY